MKEGFRQSMAWLHTWCGLVVGWVLFFVFVTGTAGYFTFEITRWMEPERPFLGAAPEYDNGALADMALQRLEQVAPGARSWNITLPHHSQASRSWENFEISWETMPLERHERGVRGSEKVDPHTGGLRTEIEPRETGGGRLLYRMHYSLHYIDRQLAFYLVGICTMLMLVALVSGVITHKKIFKDFFTFRPGKGQRSWLDAHNLISVMALPFFLMITYSGLVFFAASYMPAGIATLYGVDRPSQMRFFNELLGDPKHEPVSRPEASVPTMLANAEDVWGKGQVRSLMLEHEVGQEPLVEIGKVSSTKLRVREGETMRFHAHTGELLPPKPGDHAVVETYQTLLALHEGHFADPWLRWLYFIAGILGCGMIGTGLVLWTIKRRRNHDATGGHFGLRLVEALNVATIVGLPAAVAAYFWANRLLPLDIADRANWEANVLFLVWGETLIYAFFRDIRKAWVELSWLAAAAFLLLPILNALTTDKHLGASLAVGDWVLAGFDLSMLALGLAFAYLALRIKRIWLKKAAEESPAHAGSPSGEMA
ncbi:PepSY-associated TM helix domain-containing protein [Halopseudomonas pelagia]|uniref:PepSY-associated TM helix domain-containing protein n=1 Tax=Halopseudomonas pelagia TaxID=553151 RepID=UPI0003A125DC|nr:PepSY-associated TM helix domain-containing protein [Halopseudomonas pelagia]|tara:strand:- start:53915 stop:55531 length:1617 start_codon:yes stop_codon:yes gene_type:complete